MKKFIILLLFLLIIPTVFAETDTVEIYNSTYNTKNTTTVTALESGDSNISFSDGYNGYCSEWGEHSATIGDKFQLNNDVDNNIKTFFVYFYNESQKDVITTQHMIWKFTDNKEFSRFNKTLYNQIIEKSSTVQVPNDGFILFGENQKMIFSFRNFISEFEEYQNYFGYKIFFENNTSILNESMNNNSNTLHQQLQNFTPQIILNETYIINDNNDTLTAISDFEKTKIDSNLHETGINIKWLIICLIIMIMICLISRHK